MNKGHLPLPGSTVLRGRQQRPWMGHSSSTDTAILTDLAGRVIQVALTAPHATQPTPPPTPRRHAPPPTTALTSPELRATAAAARARTPRGVSQPTVTGASVVGRSAVHGVGGPRVPLGLAGCFTTARLWHCLLAHPAS
jgi:hypothetical protein